MSQPSRLLWLIFAIGSLVSVVYISFPCFDSSEEGSVPRNLRVRVPGGTTRGSSTSGNKCKSTACYIALAFSLGGVVLLTVYVLSRLVTLGIRWYRRVKRARERKKVVSKLESQAFTSCMLQYGFPECSICLMKYCLDSFEELEKVKITACRHIFHSA